MTRLLTVLGVTFVITAAGLAALSDAGKADPTSQPTPASAERPTATLVSDPTATPEPAPVTNRQDCNAIRGRDYLSPEERAWFLENCVTR